MHEPIPMQVYFDDADGENIVFFGNYFRIAHRAMEKYFPLIGIPWTTWFSNDSWGVPLRKVECEYFKPLKPGQNFHVTIRVVEIGESHVAFDHEFLREGQSVAKLKTTHVFADRKTFKKIPIPADMRKILEAQK